MDQALELGGPSLARIQRENGKPFIESYLKLWLVSLNKMLTLKNPLTEEAIDMVVFEVLDKYYGLSVPQLTLLSRRIVTGQYGEFYENLSVSKMVGFFDSFFSERCDMAATMSQQAHGDYLANEGALNFSRNTKRIYQGKSKPSR